MRIPPVLNETKTKLAVHLLKRTASSQNPVIIAGGFGKNQAEVNEVIKRELTLLIVKPLIRIINDFKNII